MGELGTSNSFSPLIVYSYKVFLYFSTFAVQRDRAISALERAMERERQCSDELDALRESALRAEKLERDTEALRHKCLRAEQRAVDSEVVRYAYYYYYTVRLCFAVRAIGSPLMSLKHLEYSSKNEYSNMCSLFPSHFF